MKESKLDILLGIGFLLFIMHIFLIPMSFMLKEDSSFIVGYGKAWGLWTVFMVIQIIFGYIKEKIKDNETNG
jgi:hypothetical protein